MSDTAGTSPLAAGRERFGDRYEQLLIEQYKTYLATTDKVSDRRGLTHTMFLTTNSLLITLFGAIFGKLGIDVAASPWLLPLPAAGVALALSWLVLIESYRRLNAAKFQVVHIIEAELPIACFATEWSALHSSSARKNLDLAGSEKYIPMVFIALYLGFAIGLIVSILH